MTDSIAIGVAYRDQQIVGGSVEQSALVDPSMSGEINVGGAATDTVGFYGQTPVVQRATAASHTTIATTVAVSTTTADVTSWGFATSTQANSVTAAVAELQATLVALGLWAA